MPVWGVSALTFLTAACTLLVALVSVWQSIRNGKRLIDIHMTTNSKMDRLLALTEQEALARGQNMERDRRDLADATRDAAALSTHDSRQISGG